jgi:hypothetical protein
MRNPEYGEVVFPIVSEVSDPWDNDCCHHLYSKKEIRDEYFSQIRNILNGYTNNCGWRSEDSYECFIESFNRIKGLLSPTSKHSPLEWLNLKEAKAIIKNWTGEPIDVLYYLTCNKVIERAVIHELRQRNKK